MSTRFVLWVVLITFISACTTNRPLTALDPASLAAEIAVGDKIEVERNDGSQLKFTVTEMTHDGLGGHEIFVPFTEITQLQVEAAMHPAALVFFVLLGATALYMLKEGVSCGGPFDPCFDEPEY